MAEPAQLAEHVQDAIKFDLPWGEIRIPSVWGFQLTKFMLIELFVAVLMVLIFVPLARRAAGGGPPRGRLWNTFEAMLLFLRDQVVRPTIGRHDADRYLPFIWTLFFFVLLCNLMGLVPWLGSPTAALAVTASLAAITLLVTLGSGMRRYGIVKFWLGLCPSMDLPLIMAVFLIPMILIIEIFSLFLKHTILAIRLLANMFAGHLVLAVVLFFIIESAGKLAWYGVTPVSVFGATALDLLELLVAFIQAYIFAFLASLFIGMAIHQH
jgi:F-type H+-transporting ATPase subunit a